MKTLPEQYFFRYAWPCTEVILQKNKITKERFEQLKKAAESGETPSRDVLEDTYKTAFENLRKIAKNRGKDYFDIDVINEYFELGGHNDFINSGGGEFGHAPESMKDICRIIYGTVMDIKDDIIKVSYKNNVRMCRNIYKLKLRKGDTVRIHYGYVVDKIK
ncbi:MAG: hypothetical protein NT001_07430 [Candidatus Woesearchaeota archaeon]|nr:hypothetical protein [Candidatus Woesearchaeota archaeon]